MNPAKRYNWKLAFSELRSEIAVIPLATENPTAHCEECGSVIYLIRGRHSGKWFWSHKGLAGCENVRAIFFDTREEAEQAQEVFQ